MSENAVVDAKMIREMVEDYWRSFLAVSSQYRNRDAAVRAGADLVKRFEERIAATAALMPAETAQVFLMEIEKERNNLYDEYNRNPAALKSRLNLPAGRDGSSSSLGRQGFGEMAVRTAVRATIWEAIFALFRR